MVLFILAVGVMMVTVTMVRTAMPSKTMFAIAITVVGYRTFHQSESRLIAHYMNRRNGGHETHGCDRSTDEKKWLQLERRYVGDEADSALIRYDIQRFKTRGVRSYERNMLVTLSRVLRHSVGEPY